MSQRFISAILIVSTLSAPFPRLCLANRQANPSGNEVALEMNLLKEMSGEILDLQQKITLVRNLTAEINNDQQLLNQLNFQISNLPTGAASENKRDVLEATRDFVRRSMNAFEEKLASLPTEESLQSRLQSEQKGYDERKAWLGDPEKRTLEEHEIELRIDLISEKQKELDKTKSDLDKKDVAVGAYSLGAVVAMPVVALSTLLSVDKALGRTKNSAITGVTLSILSILGIAYSTFVFDSAMEGRLKKSLARQSEELRASKEKLQAMQEAYKAVQ
jgi:hypothetical protein